MDIPVIFTGKTKHRCDFVTGIDFAGSLVGYSTVWSRAVGVASPQAAAKTLRKKPVEKPPVDKGHLTAKEIGQWVAGSYCLQQPRCSGYIDDLPTWKVKNGNNQGEMAR